MMTRFLIIILCTVSFTTASSAENDTCNFTFNSTKNYTGSISIHRAVAPNLACSWLFNRQENANFTFTTISLDHLVLLPGDTLRIYEGDTVVRNLVGPYGEDLLLYLATGNKTKITYTTADITSTTTVRGWRSGHFSFQGCSVSAAPSLGYRSLGIKSPSYQLQPNITLPSSCTYTLHAIKGYPLTFDLCLTKINNTKDMSWLAIYDGTMTADNLRKNITDNTSPEDIIMSKDQLIVQWTFKLSDNMTSFAATIDVISKNCSGNMNLSGSMILLNPPPVSADTYKDKLECRWVIESGGDNKTLAAILTKPNFTDAIDELLIKDGGNGAAPLLAQFSNTSDINRVSLSTGKYLYVRFITGSRLSGSNFSLQILGQEPGAGGYINGSNGNISFTGGSKSVGQVYYQFQVPLGKQVVLSMNKSSTSIGDDDAVLIYNGWSTRPDKLITNLTSSSPLTTAYTPVYSNQMMVVIKGFTHDQDRLVANYLPVSRGCYKSSSGPEHTYSISEDACSSLTGTNLSCTWNVAQKNVSQFSSGFYSLHFDYIDDTDDDDDDILLYIGKEKTSPAYNLTSSTMRLGRVRSVYLPGDEEFTLIYQHDEHAKRNATSNSTLPLLQASYHYRETCNVTYQNVSGRQVVSSPLYPDTYPLNALCSYNISPSAGYLLHLSVPTLEVVAPHSLSISSRDSSGGMTKLGSYSGVNRPQDILISVNTSLHLTFSSRGDLPTSTNISTSKGFTASVFSLGCGGNITGGKGDFSSPSYPTIINETRTCLWVVNYPPPSDGKSVNAFRYNVTITNSTTNTSHLTSPPHGLDHPHARARINGTKLEIRDGCYFHDDDVRRQVYVMYNNGTISNTSDLGEEKRSRTDCLWFLYTHDHSDNMSSNGTEKGFSFRVVYEFVECDASNQCGNGGCMDPAWRCNGVNDCGDNTDELQCPQPAPTIPPPPGADPDTAGVPGWSLVIMLLLGLAAGVLGVIFTPRLIRKCRGGAGPYTEFRDLGETA